MLIMTHSIIGRPETWTHERAIALLEKFLKKTIENEDIYTFQGLFLKEGMNANVWDGVNGKFKKDPDFSRIKRQIEAVIEDRIVQGMLRIKKHKSKNGILQTYQDVNHIAAIFLLKTKYGYVEKNKIENSGTLEIKCNKVLIDELKELGNEDGNPADN